MVAILDPLVLWEQAIQDQRVLRVQAIPDRPGLLDQQVQELVQLADRPSPRTVAYGTDGAMLTELKQMAVLGPGHIAQAHTWDEWIELDQLERGTALYEKLIRCWCCG